MTKPPDEIPFNRPYTTGAELSYIKDAIQNIHLSANGAFTERCTEWLEGAMHGRRCLLTHSCTGALEMAALLADFEPGDEVVMPSFTFVSTANAFVLRGAVPVFVDVREDTLNLDETKLADALTPNTRAIVPVHYAGVSCEMDSILKLARENDLMVIEDAAQAIGSSYRGRPLGSLGQLASLSFHETKNIMCGEGGALLINDDALVERAEVVQEKGTNRTKFFRDQVDKYTWIDIGSSFLMSEISAAFLWAQLGSASQILQTRLSIWGRYHNALSGLEERGLIRRPIVPDTSEHNGHMYYVLLPDPSLRDPFIARLRALGVSAVFHYVPLHDSPAGRRYGRASGSLEVTSSVSSRLVRLPLWAGMSEKQVVRVIDAVNAAIKEISPLARR